MIATRKAVEYPQSQARRTERSRSLWPLIVLVIIAWVPWIVMGFVVFALSKGVLVFPN